MKIVKNYPNEYSHILKILEKYFCECLRIMLNRDLKENPNDNRKSKRENFKPPAFHENNPHHLFEGEASLLVFLYFGLLRHLSFLLRFLIEVAVKP